MAVLRLRERLGRALAAWPTRRLSPEGNPVWGRKGPCLAPPRVIVAPSASVRAVPPRASVPKRCWLPVAARAPLSAFATVQPSKEDADDVPEENIRNFCIIAHVDHGKSTLADRLLERTGTISKAAMRDQVLDTLDIERERGITVKLQTARMRYTAADGRTYVLNLIDTPGHVDFGYEVARSLQACEGALLVVDASQGVEAQTVANAHLAVDHGLELVPVFNKMDLPTACEKRTAVDVEGTIGIDCSGAISCSAKLGLGVDDVLEAIVKTVPPPRLGGRDRPLRALIFDSLYDTFKGVVVFLRVVDGTVRPGDAVRFINTATDYECTEVGVLTPMQQSRPALHAGDVGYITAGIKRLSHARVGDTVTLQATADAVEPLRGYTEPKPMVFCGLFPTESDRFQALRDALEKLALSDSALVFAPDSSHGLGPGFRCGFLGLLHMEVVQERLEREHGLHLIVTAPSVAYRVTKTSGDVLHVSSAEHMPEAAAVAAAEEPFVDVEILAPNDCMGALMDLCKEARGDFSDMQVSSGGRVLLRYQMPLAEVITDFFDTLKSRTRGFASMDYKISGYRESSLTRLDVLINGELVAPLSMIVHRSDAYAAGRKLVAKLKELIPRQQFRVPIQAAIGGKVIASEHIAPLRKDVTAKCYGGDISRRKKLLMRQAEGKKRMKEIGRVTVPQSAFMACLSLRSSGRDS